MAFSVTDHTIKTKLPLKVKRRYLDMTQMQLANRTGINISRISMFETGQITLNERDKMKISTVMGKIDWEATEKNQCDFAMPKVDYQKSKGQGLKLRRLKNAGLEKPEVIWAGEEEDHSKYTYEIIKDGR